MKGQGARDTIKPGFEGGQLPLTQRVPKLRGFKNPFRVEYRGVNLADLERGADGSTVSPTTLAQRGLIHGRELVKILGEGEVGRAFSVEAHAFSAKAEAAIVAAGGSVVRLPKPFGHGRPPAKGNALTNR